MTDGGEYLRAGDIARLAGVSVRTVRRWIAAGELLSTKIGGARLVGKADFGRRLTPTPEIGTEGMEDDSE
ncbi:MAG TPA: helix-turn-helix domain-containing protein [Methyloceanibacter sp.]|nr:helix-turn-helix domain-containing protein [Methyloceanibacter sp.]